MSLEFSKLSSARSALQVLAKTNSSGAANRAVDAQQKRQQEMQEAVNHLRALPSPKKLARQGSMNKVGMLKQRMEALKALLLHASPEQAKALLKELKSIAKELSSEAKSLGTNRGQVGVSTPTEVGATSDSAQSSEAPVAGEQNSEPSEAGSATAAATTTASVSSIGEDAKADSGSQPAAKDGDGDGEGDDRALRAMLSDARKVLKELIGMMKSKLAAAGDEAKRDLQATEKSLAEIDKALAQGSGSELYTGQGDLGAYGMANDIAVSSVVSGLNINLSA